MHLHHKWFILYKNLILVNILKALIMPQTHTHQPTYQLIGQSPQGITNAHAHHQMGGMQVQQHPQTVGSGIPATAVSHMPPQV